MTSTVNLSCTVDPPRRGHSPSVVTRTLLDPRIKKFLSLVSLNYDNHSVKKPDI